MTQEEKARAYDEALEKARQLCAYPTTKSFISDLQDLFPELKESEDEKIRKQLIEWFSLPQKEYVAGFERKKVLAWLEKQGEQKPEENKGNIGGISANWSEDDETVLNNLIYELANDRIGNNRDEYVAWLKSLRPQNTYNPYKAVVESIAEMCKHYDKASHSGLRDFYDNVKVKCKDAQEYDKMFPQAQWKPSELQLGCLSDAIEHYNSLGYPAPKLKELLDDLKKIKEGNV